jgi:hypothetical protein
MEKELQAIREEMVERGIYDSSIRLTEEDRVQPFPRPVVKPVPPDVTTLTRSAASTHETALGDSR